MCLCVKEKGRLPCKGVLRSKTAVSLFPDWQANLMQEVRLQASLHTGQHSKKALGAVPACRPPTPEMLCTTIWESAAVFLCPLVKYHHSGVLIAHPNISKGTFIKPKNPRMICINYNQLIKKKIQELFCINYKQISKGVTPTSYFQVSNVLGILMCMSCS